MEPREIVRSHAYPIFAGICTLSILSISISLYPLAKWARSQNDCIERTFRTDGENNAGIPSKVWSCNGGGD